MIFNTEKLMFVKVKPRELLERLVRSVVPKRDNLQNRENQQPSPKSLGKAQRLSKAYHKRKTYGKKQVEYTSKIVEVRGFIYLVTGYILMI